MMFLRSHSAATFGKPFQKDSWACLISSRIFIPSRVTE